MRFRSFIAQARKGAVVGLAFCVAGTSSPWAQAAGELPTLLATPVALPQLQFAPPLALGHVADAFNAPSNTQPLIILIQDLHAHYGVQKNIAGILDFLSKKLPAVFPVAVEGAAGPVDTTAIARFPNSAIKREALDYLLREAELTGMEYFAAMHQQPHLLVGVEEGRYYNVHRELFRKTLENRTLLVSMLQGIQMDLRTLHAEGHSTAYAAIQRILDALEAGALSSQDFVTQIAALAQPTELSAFPELQKFIQNSAAGGPTQDRLHSLMREFIIRVNDQFTPQERVTLSALAKRDGITLYDDYLRDLVYRHQLFLAIPPELGRYLEYHHTLQSSDFDRVMGEARELAFHIQRRLAATPAEKNLAQVEHDLALLLKVADLQADEYDVTTFGPRVNEFVALCQSLLASHGLKGFDADKIRDLIATSIDYYVMALMRNKPMVDNTLKLLPAPHSAAAPNIAVLVTGGFHTAMLTQLLRNKNISYVVITPAVDRITAHDRTLYLQRLAGTHITRDQAAQAAQAMGSLHPGYAPALRDDLFGEYVKAAEGSSHAAVNQAIDDFRTNHLDRALPFFERLRAALSIAAAGEGRIALRLVLGLYTVHLYGDDQTAELTAGQTAHAGIRTGAIHLARGEYVRLRSRGAAALAGRLAHEAKEISLWRREARQRHQSRAAMRGWIQNHLTEAHALDRTIHHAGLTLERRISGDPSVGTFDVTEDPFDINIQAHANGSAILDPTDHAVIPLIPFVAAMQRHTGAELAEALRRRTLPQLLQKVSAQALKSMHGAYQALVYHQFTNQDTRPVIELLLNAIDTEERYHFNRSEPDAAKSVSWHVEDGRTIVRDAGEGIGLEDLTKLLYPSEGGNLGQAGTTGRFGAGFLSVFSYLSAGPGSRITVRSIHGAERNAFEFFLDDTGQLAFTYRPLTDEEAAPLDGHGTEIEIASPMIQRQTLLRDARETLGMKADATIWVNADDGRTIPLNDRRLQHVASVPLQALSGEHRGVRPALTLALDTASPPTPIDGKTEVQIFVNGVLFERFSVESAGQPATLALDFQKDVVAYARNREGWRPTPLTIEALNRLIETLDPGVLLSHAGLLYAIASRIERRLPALTDAHLDMPTETLKRTIGHALYLYPYTTKTVLAEDARLEQAVDTGRTSYVFLPKALIPEHRRASHETSLDGILYLPFKPDSNTFAVVTQDGLLAVDERLRPVVESPATRSEMLALLESVRTVSASAYSVNTPSSLLPPLPAASLAMPAAPVPSPNAAPQNAARLAIKQRIAHEFTERIRAARTLQEFERLILWNRFLGLTDLDASIVLDLGDPLIDAFGFPFRDAPETFAQRVNQITEAIRTEADGKPIPPTVSPQAKALHHQNPFRSIPDQLALFAKASHDRTLLKDVLIWGAYRFMLESYEEPNSLGSRYATAKIHPVLHRLQQAAYRIQPPVYTTDGAAVVLIQQKHPHFTPWIQAVSMLRLFNAPPQIPAFAVRLNLTNNYKFAETYSNLVSALLEKWRVTPDQTDLMMKAFSSVDQFFEDTFAGLSEDEARELLNWSLLKQLASMDYAAIVQALHAPGTLHARLLPQLFLHFADTPALGRPPAHTIAETPTGGLAVPLSSLIYAQADAEHNGLTAVHDVASLERFMEHEGRPQAAELLSRSQAAIKRAYEQTTDELAFLREMTTNAYEANRQEPGGARSTFRVSSWMDPQNRFVLTMEDAGVGMTLQDIVGNLLQPNVSEWNSEARHFGQGFFTLFRSADHVRLQTTRNGVTTTAYLVPVFKNGALIDINARFTERPATAEEVGTRIEWVKATATPERLGATMWTSLNNYVGLFDPTRMTILWNGEPLNQHVAPLAQVRAANGDVVTFSEAAGLHAFNLNQVYMRDLDDAFLWPVPRTVRALLLKHGVLLNLDSETAEPLEGRTDFVGRPQRIDALRGEIAQAGVQAALRLLMEGKLDLGALPHDWIRNAETYAPAVNRNPHTAFIAADAQHLADHVAIDWAPYSDGQDADRNSLLLLLSVPGIEFEGRSWSVFDLVIQAKQDAGFRDRLPAWLKAAVDTALAEAASGKALQQTRMAEQNAETVKAEPLRSDDDHAEVLRVWQSLVEHTLSVAGVQSPRVHEFYTRADGAVAHTRVGQNNIAWNLVSIRPALELLHGLLRGPAAPESAALAHVLYQIIETGTHEEVHIERGESEAVWTHTPEFFKDQLTLLNRMLGHYLPGHPAEGTLQDQLARSRQALAAVRIGPRLELPARFLKETPVMAEHPGPAPFFESPSKKVSRWTRMINFFARHGDDREGDAHSDILPMFFTGRWARGWRYFKAAVRNRFASETPELLPGLAGQLANHVRTLKGVTSAEVVVAPAGTFAPPARYELIDGHARIIVNGFLQMEALDLAEALAHELGHLDPTLEREQRPAPRADGRPHSRWSLAYWQEERWAMSFAERTVEEQAHDLAASLQDDVATMQLTPPANARDIVGHMLGFLHDQGAVSAADLAAVNHTGAIIIQEAA